jgi:hypothetical protein
MGQGAFENLILSQLLKKFRTLHMEPEFPLTNSQAAVSSPN